MSKISSFLSNQDTVDLTKWRRLLHQNPEISGEEERTAKFVVAQMKRCNADQIVTNLGGHGVAAIFDSGVKGPTLLIRSELDALPIQQISDAPHQSQFEGVSHLCGHDGHMATLAALAVGLDKQRPKTGRVILMFQPAEETGAGAAAVIADSRFAKLQPDFSFSLHNMSGVPLGHVVVQEGPFNCASRGLHITLTGQTAHAGQPEAGTSPMVAISQIMPALAALSEGTAEDHDLSMVTVTHARLGEATFGIAPGFAGIFATLRTVSDTQMNALVETTIALTQQVADAEGLIFEHSFQDVFDASQNHPEATEHLQKSVQTLNIPTAEMPLPLRASEDFGRFGQHSKSAMFFLGSGVDHPALHTPTYDFPDDLIPIGARIFMQTIRDLLG